MSRSGGKERRSGALVVRRPLDKRPCCRRQSMLAILLLPLLRPVGRLGAFITLIRQPGELALILQSLRGLDRLRISGLLPAVHRVRLQGLLLIALYRKKLLSALARKSTRLN